MVKQTNLRYRQSRYIAHQFVYRHRRNEVDGKPAFQISHADRSNIHHGFSILVSSKNEWDPAGGSVGASITVVSGHDLRGRTGRLLTEKTTILRNVPYVFCNKNRECRGSDLSALIYRLPRIYFNMARIPASTPVSGVSGISTSRITTG